MKRVTRENSGKCDEFRWDSSGIWVSLSILMRSEVRLE